MDLKNNITAYLRYCSEQRTLSSKTTKAYQTDLLQFADFFRKRIQQEHHNQLYSLPA